MRVTSNSLKGGRYYNVKVVIADVTRPGYCNVVTPEGKMLEGGCMHVDKYTKRRADLTERDLETVIPKEANARVMVVRGPHQFKVGKLMKVRQCDPC